MERPRWFAWVILAALSLCLPAAAQAKAVFLNPSLFGKLNQQNTIITARWGNEGCPPTAMVNALVYLQKNYPSVYGTYLVADYSSTTMANTAVTLGGSGYLNGQFYDSKWHWPPRDFLWGAYLYMQAQDQNMAPRTNWSGASGPPYLAPWNWTEARPLPAWAAIIDFAPNANYLYNALSASKAVVILWYGITIGSDGTITYNGKGHYLTVTGLTWNDNSNTGTLYYIDPKGGSARTSPLWILQNGLLGIDYGETNGVPWQGSAGNWWYSGPAAIVMGMTFGPPGVAPVQPARHGAPPHSLLLLLD